MDILYFKESLLSIAGVFLLFSCQNDNYQELEPTPFEYEYSIPGELKLTFKQQSKNTTSIVPYDNSLSFKNISNKSISSEFYIFSFKESIENYSDLDFIYKGSISSIESGEITENMVLDNTNYLFTDENILVSVTSINDLKHELSGKYSGEINIHVKSDNSFVKTLLVSGVIDYQGVFHFFTESSEEEDLVYFKGLFNSLNVVTGSIYNKDNAVMPLKNMNEENLSIENDELKGDLWYVDGAEEYLIKFNLTKQN